MSWFRPLGSTGIEVSALGLGTVKFGRNRKVKYPKPFALPSDKEARSLLSLAWDSGINLLDTAPAYGDSEQRLGQLLRGQRDNWVLCTKVGEEFEEGQSRFDFSAAHTRRSVERSLQRLQTDVLDLVTLHSDGNDLALLQHGEALGALCALKREGCIRAVGLSAKTPAGVVAARDHCDVVMIALNPAEQSALSALQTCVEQGVGILLKKPLGSGHLALEAEQLTTSLALAMAHCGNGSALIGTLSQAHLEQNILIAKGIVG
jgi:aryl-alcohol dehydrogenase-like predicted oxidoreductase